jgi:SAM-dependent methyltransferase
MRNELSDDTHDFYGVLAEWWPLISPLAEYGDEAAEAVALLRTAEIPVVEVLELGSGGGHMAHHLARHFTMTLVDLSPQMLAVSRALNPGSEHVHGDMRTVRLERTFDAVFIHDAVDYMLTHTDLRAALDTAFVHCRPGGVAVVIPDHTSETFAPDTAHGGSDAPDGRGARYVEWMWDPDPDDTWVQTDYAFVLRDADGATRSAHDRHRTGLFPQQTWLDTLAEVGFSALAVTEQTGEERAPRTIFVGHRPHELSVDGSAGSGATGPF